MGVSVHRVSSYIMHIPRIYINSTIALEQTLVLSDAAAHHIQHVLRLKQGASLIIFNGEGGQYRAEITAIKRNQIILCATEYIHSNVESPLHIHLGQAISRGEKMDFTLQKSVELGVSEITPIISKRCAVKLSEQRSPKKMERWQTIIINASEQCGRSQLARLNPPIELDAWLTQLSCDYKITLSPDATHSLPQLPLTTASSIALLIGPESGLSAEEIALSEQHGFTAARLGPRILRTETAALTAISILQSQWGDLLT